MAQARSCRSRPPPSPPSCCHPSKVLRASTPPRGDYDYGYDSNDGVDQRTLQRQGEEVDVINVSGNGQAAGAAATAAPGPVAAVAERPAFGTAAEGRGPTQDIRRRAISIGQLFGRTATTTKKTKRVSGPEVRRESGVVVPTAAAYGATLLLAKLAGRRALLFRYLSRPLFLVWMSGLAA